MQEIKIFLFNHLFLIGIWIVLFSIIIYIFLRNFFSKIVEINNMEATNLMNKNDGVIIDLRNKFEYCQGHIINSINLSTKDIMQKKIDNLIKEKNKPIILVDSINKNSRNVANFLIRSDFKKVYILKNGIYGWKKEHLPIIVSK